MMINNIERNMIYKEAVSIVKDKCDVAFTKNEKYPVMELSEEGLASIERVYDQLCTQLQKIKDSESKQDVQSVDNYKEEINKQSQQKAKEITKNITCNDLDAF